MRPKIEVRLASSLVVVAMVLTACALDGDDPAKDPVPSTTLPPVPASDAPAPHTGVPDEEWDAAHAPAPADEGRPVGENATIQGDISNETRGPEVPVTSPHLLDANVVDGWPSQIRDPEVEIEIPPLPCWGDRTNE